MNIDINKIPVLISKLKDKIKTYAGFIIVIIILVTYGALIWKISSYVTQEPSESKVSEELTSINIPKVDEEAIKQITQLEESNVQVKALFENARQNPFTE